MTSTMFFLFLAVVILVPLIAIAFAIVGYFQSFIPPPLLESSNWQKLMKQYPVLSRVPEESWVVSEIGWSKKQFLLAKYLKFIELTPFSDVCVSINYDENGVYLRPRQSFLWIDPFRLTQMIMTPRYKDSTILIPWTEVIEVKHEGDLVCFCLRDGKELFLSNSNSRAIENSQRFSSLMLDARSHGGQS